MKLCRADILDDNLPAKERSVIHLKNLTLGFYNVMPMRETQTQFGQKYIILLITDLNGTLGLWHSNKEMERFMRLIQILL